MIEAHAKGRSEQKVCRIASMSCHVNANSSYSHGPKVQQVPSELIVRFLHELHVFFRINSPLNSQESAQTIGLIRDIGSTLGNV